MEEIRFSHYGELREVNATDEERKMFEILQEMVEEKLELVRKSDSYVTAAIHDWDIARFKYTPRAKWIAFPTIEVGYPKHRILAPDDIKGFSELIAESLNVIRKYI